MSNSPNLSLPYLLPSQAQKHVTHNEALRRLDALVQLAVSSRQLAGPPSTPADGSRFIIAAGATGDWSGHDGAIAAFQDGAWEFMPPAEGWLCWVEDEEQLLVANGGNWQQAASLPETAELLGINTAADTANRLAVKSDAVLFSHDDVTPGTGDVRLSVNKAQSAATASFLFQDQWSGRAELGLAGNDDFSLKVSNDGSTWTTAMVIDHASGEVSFPATGFAPSSAIMPPADIWTGRAGGLWFPGPENCSVNTDGSGGTPSIGDPVGRVSDLSGNGLDLTATSNAERPLLLEGGYLQFDGVDDVMMSGLSGRAFAEDCWFFAVLDGNYEANLSAVGISGTGDPIRDYLSCGMQAHDEGGNLTARLQFRQNSVGLGITAAAVTGVTDSGAHYFECFFRASDGRLAATVDTAFNGSATVTGHVAGNGTVFLVGRESRESSTTSKNCRVAACGWLGAIPTQAEKARIRAWVASTGCWA